MTIQRKSNLAFEKWADLRAAFTELIRSRTYERLVRIHADMQMEPDGFAYARHRMHGTMSGPLGYRRFLPWHRAYLIVLERELRRLDQSLSIPYWDWNADAGRLVGFRNLVGLSSGRELGSTPSEEPSAGRGAWFSDDAQVARLVSPGGDYYTFSRALEGGPHNGGHVWIGGEMNSMASPRDPAFWFHHAQVDRIWSLWQQNNPGERAHLAGREAKLDPWGSEFSIESVDDNSDLGVDSYEYV